MTQTLFIDWFNKITKQMNDLVKLKNQDYAGENGDALHNFNLIESLSKGFISAEQGILVRITDKVARITNLLQKEAAVKSESLDDTLIDLANYAIILLILVQYRRRKSKS